jgi:RNase H-like domain found in reverse transcriptase
MLLAYSDFSKPFDVYTDASHSQLSAAICQNDKLIALYSCKLNPTQTLPLNVSFLLLLKH